MDSHRPTDDDDISPIRESLPEGPPAPVLPILLQWALLAAAGFAMRLSPDVTTVRGIVQDVGIVAAIIAAGIALRLVATKSVTARISGAFGLLIAACEVAYLFWLLGTRA